MKALSRRFVNEQGIVLVIALLILALLMVAGVGAIVSTQTDFKSSGNFKRGTQAFYFADAGIEWAKMQIKNSGANPPNPAGGTVSYSGGTFTVTFSGAARESQLAGTIIVTSTGNFGGASSMVQAKFRKTYDLSDGAISLRGNEADAAFTGNAFFVDGKDYDPGGGLVPNAKPEYGISVPNAALGGQVRNAVGNTQLDNIQGNGYTVGVPNIEETQFLPSSEMAQLANDLCSDPAANLQTIRGAKLIVSPNTTWGSPTSPQLHCIVGGTSGGTGSRDEIEFRGNFSGYGILVVRDANVQVNGSFDWGGLILVTGQNVSFRIAGGGNRNLYGSLMVNEQGSDGEAEIDLQGATRVLYSRSALNNALSLFPANRNPLANVYDSLPSTLTQIYWRTVTN